MPDSKVYADPVTMAFHPDLYTSEADLQAVKNYSDQISMEYRAAIESDTLPEKVRNMLSRTLLEDNSNLPASVKLSKERNREYVRRIFELHQSGIGPRNSPEMMNLLHNVFATEAFRIDRHGRFLPVMPDTMRFALASEVTESLGGSEISSAPYLSRESISRKVKDSLTGLDKLESSEVLKFRVSGHKMLFGAGEIPEFFESLGGFDLDDKGLFKLESFTDAGGRKKLMFAISRQPSGIQEVIYASARLGDADTVKGILGGNERMMKFIKELATAPGISPMVTDPATRARAVEHMNAAKFLIDVVGNLKTGFTESQVEQAIFTVYEAAGRTVKEMQTETVDKMFEYGPSALRKSIEGGTAYKTNQVIKLLKAENAFGFGDMSEQALEILDKYSPALGKATTNRLRKALETGNSKDLAAIFDANADSPAMRAFQDHTIFRKMLATSSGDGNFLGVFVNRSMVVGSTIRQLDDTLKNFDDVARSSEELKKLLSYKIGLFDSETAIDSTINFASKSFNIEELVGDIESIAKALDIHYDALNPDVAQKAIIKKLGFKTGGVTLDDVGAVAIESLGKRLGGMAAISRSDKYASLKAVIGDIGLGIDEVLLSDRIADPDLTRLIAGITTGFKEVKEAGRLTGDQIIEFEKKIKQLEEMEGGYSGQRAIIMELFALNEKHTFASLAKVNERTARVAAEFEMLSRLYLSSMGGDAALLSTRVSEDARRAAQFIIDRNKEEFAAIINQNLSELTDTEKALLTEKKFRLGNIVRQEMEAAASKNKVGMEEMINAVEQVSAERKAGSRAFDFSLEKLAYIDDDGVPSFLKRINAARIRRNARFHASSVDASMKNLITAFEAQKASILSGLGPDDTKSEERIFAQAFGDLSEDAARSAEDRYISKVLAGKELDSTLVPEEAANIRRKASVIRTAIGERAITPEIHSALTSTVADPGLSDDFMEGLDAAVKGEDYSSFTKTKFTRFSDFIKSGKLKEIFNENKLFRNSVYATTALIAASFAYQAHKDHTSDTVKGPPLLPGGSAYEQGYPQRMPDIPNIGTVSYNPGVSYKVNLYGNKSSVQSFQDMAMELGNFDMDTTIYSGIRQVGVDPYQQLASSY